MVDSNIRTVSKFFRIFYHHSKLLINPCTSQFASYFCSRQHPKRLVPMAVMMCLNGFESVFEYDLSYNCTETSSG